MTEFVFWFLALGTCVAAFLTVISRHIFHSATYLSLCLLNISGIYFLLGADFVGVIQVLVYIGGIITLFIFAIKLTARIDDQSIQQTNRQTIPCVLAATLFFIFLIYIITHAPWSLSEPQASLNLKDLGRSLMTVYVLPFEFISLVLLAVMVGAIVIGRVKK